MPINGVFITGPLDEILVMLFLLASPEFVLVVAYLTPVYSIYAQTYEYNEYYL